jgi:hypothetical protein
MTNMASASRPRAALAIAGLSAAILLAACATAGAPSASPSPAPPSPAPSARPTPTPIVAPARTAQQAAALVIATNPLFAGARAPDPEMIGASKWWKATPLAAGGYSIEMTVGWGDCPAGCINRHVWTFEVSANGQVKLVSETGDPVEDVPA